MAQYENKWQEEMYISDLQINQKFKYHNHEKNNPACLHLFFNVCYTCAIER